MPFRFASTNNCESIFNFPKLCSSPGTSLVISLRQGCFDPQMIDRITPNLDFLGPTASLWGLRKGFRNPSEPPGLRPFGGSERLLKIIHELQSARMIDLIHLIDLIDPDDNQDPYFSVESIQMDSNMVFSQKGTSSHGKFEMWTSGCWICLKYPDQNFKLCCTTLRSVGLASCKRARYSKLQLSSLP